VIPFGKIGLRDTFLTNQTGQVSAREGLSLIKMRFYTNEK